MSGSRTETVFDSVTADASGGTDPDKTSTVFDVQNDEQISLQIDGDANSSNFDLRAEAKVSNNGTESWAELKESTAEDITVTVNNSKIYSYDATNLLKVRWVFVNNAASATTFSGYAGRLE